MASELKKLGSYLRRLVVLTAVALITGVTPLANASPFASPGDHQLRHDLEYLADRGLLSVPLTTWPMTWADISSAVASIDSKLVSNSATRSVIIRLEKKIAAKVRWGVPRVYQSIGLSDNRTTLRGFDDIPRGSVEIAGGIEYTGQSFAANLNISLLDDNEDDQDFRLDGSYLAFIWDNTSISVGAQPQWWGPGQGGSLILSNNARPVPGLMIKRNVSSPFQHRWLRWIGPWTTQTFIGRLESDRAIPNAYLLGTRFSMKPFRSLELGVSRTAQWGGDSRPESFSSFVDLLLGQDNVEDGDDRSQEPGNQLAGFDMRFSTRILTQPFTLYGQIIGEDEAGGFPSRYLGQGGVSTSFPVKWTNSTVRLNLEYSDTTCQFYESSRRFNCAYNHPIYADGYRYRGRSLGYSTDNDARQLALIGTYNSADRISWSATLKGGTLNRGGNPDVRNTVATTPTDFFEVRMTHTRPFYYGKLDVGVGYRNFERNLDNNKSNDLELSVRWSSKEF